MAAARTPVRRRQRSLRVTSSVVLLSVSSAVVLVGLATRSPLWLGLTAVLALALAWAGLRAMWTEVLESRRENAADRAAAAAAYRNLFAVRAAEQAEFAEAMTARLAEAHLSARQLEGLIVQHETRAQRAETKLEAETTAHEETRGRVRQLEQVLVAVQKGEGADSVVDLVTWDEQTAKARKAGQRRSLKQA